jgi:hypothetical protein
MSRVVYGNYAVQHEPTAFGQLRYQYTGVELNTKLWFGNLIQKEFVVFTNFSFKPNFDAGVFEYSNATVPGTGMGLGDLQEQLYDTDSLDERKYVYHFDKGIVYPKQVDVDCSVVVLHEDPLGFGGIRRSPNSIKWAMNYDMHWPHNVPETDIPSYMRSTSETIVQPPEVVPESPPPTDASNAEVLRDTTADNPEQSSQPDPGMATIEAENGETYGTFEVDGTDYYIDEDGKTHTVLPE